MSGDQLDTYIIAGKRYAARSQAQALLAHRIASNPNVTPRAVRDASRRALLQRLGLGDDYKMELDP